MKTVDLTDGHKAISVITKIYLTRGLLIDIATHLCYHDELNLMNNKSHVIKKVREHLAYQGRTTYCDWYEDTAGTEAINEIHPKVVIMIDNLFPELTKTE
jgi:hypothetical protein